MGNREILSAIKIKKSFGGVQALKGVDLKINQGEIHCLAGENGCGKSTLIKIISGVYTPDSGQVVIGGQPYYKLSPKESISRGIQVIYQDFSLFPNLTVLENLALNQEIAARRKFINHRRMRTIAESALDRINYDIDLEAKVSELHITDRQMIAIARALLSEAKLIIMDEPTSALTRREINNLFKVIDDLKCQGISILFVSHKLDEVFEISDTVTILRNGENVITSPAVDISQEKFSYYMTGRNIQTIEDEPKEKSSKRLLELKGFNLKGAYKDVDLCLYEGEILGITGQLGSGRTELAKSIFGLMQADKGDLYVEGDEVQIDTVGDALALDIAYLPEDRLSEGLFMPQSVAINGAATRLNELSSKTGKLDKRTLNLEIEDWVERLSVVVDDIQDPIRMLSGGNQQKIVLAKWLARNPKILILNSPTFGVDIGAKFDIYGLLKLYADRGISIIVASDDLTELITLCDRIIVMRNGRIVDTLEKDSISLKKLAELAR